MTLSSEACTQILGLEDSGEMLVEAAPEDESLRLTLGP